jgi:hypothetical protein
VPFVERRTLTGNKDRGDIAGIPGVVIEAKATKTALLAQYVDEAVVEAEHDNARIGVVWMKRVGYTSPGDGYVVMDGITFTRLLIDGGYIPDVQHP